MSVKISVKKKFVINGKEYSSVEEMPENIRKAYEKAVTRSQGTAQGRAPGIVSTKIIFNGKEYENEDAMPPDVQQLYKSVIVTISKNEETFSGEIHSNMSIKNKNDDQKFAVVSSKPITPDSSISLRKLLLGAAIIVLFGLLYLFYFHGAK